MKVLDRDYSSFLARQAKKGEKKEMEKFLQVCNGGKEGQICNFGKR